MERDVVTPHATLLSDYKPTAYQVDSILLRFDLHETQTRVRSELTIRRRQQAQANAPLVLHGEDLKLISVTLNDTRLTSEHYELAAESLTIFQVPEQFKLEIETEINPRDNTTLNGLYLSSGNFCTQCEAEGFRRITYMYDRPDVLTRYKTTIFADREQYPVLLSNGNLLETGVDPDDSSRHFAVWDDPFLKPTYLFALVAGSLSCIEDSFTTMSRRKVQLRIYVQAHNIDQCDHAMLSLKNAMKWDEEVYGREYDLDIYMVVAVDDFNMGAMENKGLNVFNSKYVLAKPETATDGDYEGIEGVIGHEYFHNWSGNRVTCRDWFQLSLKEGFTVFRDQEFSSDMTSRGVKRISDVNILRTHQFREDAGPMAHPVRPESYVEINNFYTVTVYNKGAEVVRMLHHLLGASGFRKGTDLYFDRHDGQAVTCDDFVKALEDANNVELTQFRRWYSQAGTPELHITRKYDNTTKTYALTIKQNCPPTPGQPVKQPFHIPLAVGLIDKNGKDIPLKLQDDNSDPALTRVLHIREPEQVFVFQDVDQEPVPSLLRGFSAPVKVKIDLSDSERSFLMAHDSDDFNRWDAGQQLAVKMIVGLVKDFQNNRKIVVNPGYVDAVSNLLADDKVDKALLAQAIALPAESYISEFVSPVDPVAIHKVCRSIRQYLASELREHFYRLFTGNQDNGDYKIDQQSIKKRKIKNACLGYLMELGDSNIQEICYQQFRDGNNMTDVMSALVSLANNDCPQREQALQEFYDKWKSEFLVVDKWLAIQATSRLPGALERVKSLVSHEAFNLKNPNKVRALVGSFGHGNFHQFHDASGKGYEFYTQKILELDAINPQIASRLATVYTMWKRYDDIRKNLMKQQLERLANHSKLSKDTLEIVTKSLGG